MLYHNIGADFCEGKPDFTVLNGYEKHKDSYDGNITIDQHTYFNLLKKAKYFMDFMEVLHLINLIGEKGGREYNDLMSDKIDEVSE